MENTVSGDLAKYYGKMYSEYWWSGGGGGEVHIVIGSNWNMMDYSKLDDGMLEIPIKF